MAEVLEILRRAVEEGTKDVSLGSPLTAEEARKARSLLSAFLRQYWSSPLGLKIKERLEDAAQEYGKRLESLAKELKLNDRYREAAKEVNLGSKFKSVWGKT